MHMSCRSSFPEGWDIQIVRSLEAIEAIRPFWRALQSQDSRAVLDSDIDRYLSILKYSEDQSKPFILLLKQNDQIRAMVVGRLGEEQVHVRLGYATLMRPKLRCISVVYGGVLGQLDEQVSLILIRGLAAVLKKEGIDGVSFNHLRRDSVFHKQIIKNLSGLYRNHFAGIDLHWRMSIPEDTEVFFQKLSRHHRGNLKRAIKKLENTFPGKIRAADFSHDSNVDRPCREAEEVSLKTYQHGLGSGFCANSSIRSVIETDVKLNRFRMTILYIDDRPCAFQWGTVLGDTYFLEMIGYDPQWSSYGIGNCLFIKSLELLCADSSLRYIDFGFGDAGYKERYGDESCKEAKSTFIFAHRLRPLLINITISLNGAVTLGITWIVKKMRVYEWIKRNWRKKLSSNE